jgi:hypothetical protein
VHHVVRTRNTWFSTLDSSRVLAGQHSITKGPQFRPVVYIKSIFLVDNLVRSGCDER